MPFNGSGTAVGVARPAYPPESNEIIYAAYFIQIIDDLLGMLSNCVTRDGQSAWSQNLPANNKKLTGLLAGIAVGDSVAWGQAVTFSNLTLTSTLTVTAPQTLTNTWDFTGGEVLVQTKPPATTGNFAASVDFTMAAVTTAISTAPVVEQSIAALAILNFYGA